MLARAAFGCVQSKKNLEIASSKQLSQRRVSAGGDSYGITEDSFAPIVTLVAERRPAIDLKMRLNLDDCVRSLCSSHSWISFEESRVLLLDAYRRFPGQEKYGGNIVQTLLAIELSILQRSSDQELKQRLAVAREWF